MSPPRKKNERTSDSGGRPAHTDATYSSHTMTRTRKIRYTQTNTDIWTDNTYYGKVFMYRDLTSIFALLRIINYRGLTKTRNVNVGEDK